MFEETGAIDVKIEPVCLYSISSYGIICYAEILKLGDLPESEIECVQLFDDVPENLTYPDAHKLFFDTVKEYMVDIVKE